MIFIFKIRRQPGIGGRKRETDRVARERERERQTDKQKDRQSCKRKRERERSLVFIFIMRKQPGIYIYFI